MKNWLTYEKGSWHNGVLWESSGYATFDPNAVKTIEDINFKLPEAACLIYFSGAHYICVKKSREEVIVDIQSAL